ncbi:hypothetical protein AB0G73_37165 [Streptomyces sp. NPDC020719]|uniref:HNH endonuclease n=1 Tax=Streptomyces sp. NPDC020719 TaxID=3154896 RepID=UPI0033C510BF
MSGRCELCKAQTEVEVHHIRRLSDLRPGSQAEQPDWAKQMASRRRKTLTSAVTATTESIADSPFGRTRWNRRWRAGCGDKSHARFGGGPSEKGPHQRTPRRRPTLRSQVIGYSKARRYAQCRTPKRC